MRKLIYSSAILIVLTSCKHKTVETIEEIVQAEVEQPSELFKTIAMMDSLMFSTAQKDCDLETYASFLAEDFEYFHDKAGFTESKEKEMADMAIFCGERQRARQPLRRQLTKGTLKVFPMDNYGALEFCDHIFYLQINDGTEKVVGSGKMTALWKKENNTWKLTRIISYDHQPLAEVELTGKTLNQYVGDYSLPDRIVNIKREGKLLRATDVNDGKPGWTTQLFPESENRFYFNYENVVYEFIKSGTKIETLNIYENGKLIEEAKRK
ncbi:nuclear transport factor 2 family protein [Aquimarina sp. 2201CG5-10]|uniref:nuclear transport factor 2 family protein n=1 Tax=Aquimarina callyspongiae TaxID=3098150 RepID=UPI002AB4886B|nr:nuclear transport factor 2 family protein [Aquimarina sp. 2201CG5-10]MDY8137269.1 nuclear transport factor 2 family protein [Aquimarina sp. 2201CG5-10]